MGTDGRSRGQFTGTDSEPSTRWVIWRMARSRSGSECWGSARAMKARTGSRSGSSAQRMPAYPSSFTNVPDPSPTMCQLVRIRPFSPSTIEPEPDLSSWPSARTASLTRERAASRPSCCRPGLGVGVGGSGVGVGTVTTTVMIWTAGVGVGAGVLVLVGVAVGVGGGVGVRVGVRLGASVMDGGAVVGVSAWAARSPPRTNRARYTPPATARAMRTRSANIRMSLLSSMNVSRILLCQRRTHEQAVLYLQRAR